MILVVGATGSTGSEAVRLLVERGVPVRALTRVATAENESDLLELARGCTTEVLERMVRGWKLGSREDEEERERRRIESRSFSVFPGEDGMYEVRGRLTPEQGALLMRAVEAASDALFKEREIPDGVPAFDVFYDMQELWPAASLERVEAMRAAARSG